MTTPTQHGAVFLDRDGVLNHVVLRQGKPHPPASVEDLTIPADVPEALRQLKAAGFQLIVVTNQPDVARGTQTLAAVEAIHARLMERLPLDAIRVCYDDGESPRRKPNPGMLLEAAAEFGVALGLSYMIGDRWKDVAAGRRAGCRTLFLDAGYQERKPEPPADWTGTNLDDAASWILRQAW